MSGLFEDETGYRLAIGARQWVTLTPAAIDAGGDDVNFNGAATVWTGSSILVMGGEWCPGSCPRPFGGGDYFVPSTHAWAQVPSFAVNQQQWPAVWTGRAFIDTGSGAGPGPPGNNVLGAYDPISQKWFALPQAPAGIGDPSSDSFPEAVWTGTQLLVWGEPSEALTPA
ncbi:MAG: hypothetical protein ACYDC0_12590 [Acidimicrobiales bacterium]